MTSIVCDVPREHLAALWPQVEPHIARALDREGYGRMLPCDVLEMLALGRAKLWISWNMEEKAAEAAMVSEVLQYPRRLECCVTIAGGRNMRAWIDQWLATIEAYARAHGCDQISAGGRKGWQRLLTSKVAGSKPYAFGVIKQF